MVRARGVCFTMFDMKKGEEIKGEDYRYLVIGFETCPKTGKKHLQGYIEFENARSLASLGKRYNCHVEKRRGTPTEASEYCKKEELVFEDGELPVQGKRNDITKVKDIIKKGGNMREVMEEAENLQQVKIAEKYLRYFEIKRTWKPEVFWYWGNTGVGKTKRATLEAGTDVWVNMGNLRWFEGYDGHENVIIDDFRPNQCRFTELLRLLDRYEYRIENKGSSRQFLAKRIWITSSESPAQMFENMSGEDVSQLIRRIDVIEELTQKSR